MKAEYSRISFRRFSLSALLLNFLARVLVKMAKAAWNRSKSLSFPLVWSSFSTFHFIKDINISR